MAAPYNFVNRMAADNSNHTTLVVFMAATRDFEHMKAK